MPSGRFRLSAVEVAKARKLYREGVNLMPLARRFGVTVTTIREAITGETWKFLPDPVPLRRPQKSEAAVRQALRELHREESRQ